MKKLFRALLAVVLGAFVVSSLTLKADKPNVEKVDGASIRTETLQSAQGLRFYAKLNEQVDEHGFYLVFGQATVNDLEVAIAAAGEGDVYLNGKIVFKKDIPGVNQDNEFSIVLTGIPDVGYFDNISVIAYAVKNNTTEFAVPTTRSIAEVALKMVKVDGVKVSKVLDYLEDNYYKVAWNDYGQYEISSILYEYNYTKIRDEFLNDFNTVNGTSFVYSGIYGSGAPRHKAFWTNEEMHEKWLWLANYILSLSYFNDAISEWTAIVNKGELPSLMWASRQDLQGFLTGTRCASYSGYAAINFADYNTYSTLNQYNDNYYIVYDNYSFVKKGEQITLPNKVDKNGYTFLGYDDGTIVHDENASVTINQSILFAPSYSTIPYTITYYDGEDELSLLPNSYNVESAVNLPVPEKEGFEFEGWYEDEFFAGEKAIAISKGTTGNKTFYAKWLSLDLAYEIVYELDGGHFIFDTKDKMINGFLEDFYNYLGLETSLNEFKHGVGNSSGYDGTWHSAYQDKIYAGPRPTAVNEAYFASSSAYMDKWLPFFDMMDSFVKTVNDTQYFWGTSNGVGLIRIKQYVRHVKPASYVSDATMNMMPNPKIVAPAITEGVRGIPLTLENPIKAGKEFDGWYDNPGFTGNKITVLNPEDNQTITLYAKWN